MSGGAFVTSTTPNAYVLPVPPGSPALGAVVDTGATQDTAFATFDIGGVAGDGTVVDILESQDGTNFVFLTRLFGGDPSKTLNDVSRYFRTLRQAGTAAVVVQWGKTTSSAGGGTLALINGGNATGPISAGTLDGSQSTFGGLSAGSATVVNSGAGAATRIQAAGTNILAGTASGATTVGSTTGSTVLQSSAAGIVIGNTAAALSAGNTVIDSPSGGAQILLGGPNVAAIVTTDAPQLSAITLDLSVAGTIAVGGGTIPTVVQIGNNHGASTTLVEGGTGGIGIGTTSAVGNNTTIDAPVAGGAVSIAGTNATATVIGKSGGTIGLYGGTAVAQPSRVGQLTNFGGAPAPTTSIADVTNAFSQSILNQNFTDLLTKINAIEAAIHGIGLTA